MDQEESQLVRPSEDADSSSKQMMRQAKAAAHDAEERMKDLLKHLKDVHERIEILHERDEDYDTRLHNSYFYIAEARGDKAKATDALQRETRRREAEQVKYNMTIDRIRNEREQLRLEVNRLQAELKVEKEKNDEVARIWREEAREEKRLPRLVVEEDHGVGSKRKGGVTGENGGGNNKAFKTPATLTARGPLTAKDNQLNSPNRILAPESATV